ncbi:MAG TPA: cytochrome c maturation protein CcmE [Candidatus Binatia bacterium]|nr:cytochrome c maturation protein CcmE [Candidatus Binatia bacterium]
MNRNLRFLVGSMVIVAAIAYLMYTGIRETSAYYLTIQEFLPKRDQMRDTPLRIAGRVQPGSISYDARTLDLRFHLAEFTAANAAEPSLPVAFTGIKPDMFADGRDVIVEGRYSGDVLHASQVLTSCPSKYEAKTVDPTSPQAARPTGGREAQLTTAENPTEARVP